MATDYRPRVERALRYIAENLSSPLTVADVARAAHSSEFHFHRIFAAVVGEPVGRFVTRKRLELAALRLAYEPSRSVTDIALSSGYSSPSNFSKAFSAHFGCAPTHVRSPGAAPPPRLAKLSEKAWDPSSLYTLPPDAEESERRREYAALSSRVRFEKREATLMIALSSPLGYDLAALEQTWAELITRCRELDLASGPVDAWGMAFDSPSVTSAELCRYHACVPLVRALTPPAPLFLTELPAGKYAVFPYEGAVEGVEALYRAIYSVWLPQSNLEPDDFVAVDHYVNDGPVDGAIAMEICIKVVAT